MSDLLRFSLVCVVASAIAGSLLAIPAISFWFVLLTFGFGLILLLAIGALAIGGPVVVLLFASFAAFKVFSWREFQVVTAIWISALILHAGFSMGKSHWGDVARTMGGKNQTYARSFWQPYMAARYGLKGLE